MQVNSFQTLGMSGSDLCLSSLLPLMFCAKGDMPFTGRNQENSVTVKELDILLICLLQSVPQ